MSQPDFDSEIKSLLNESVPIIHVKDLRQKLDASEDLTLLDIRSPEEFEVSHIAGARFIDYENFSADQVADFDKNQPVVVYCSVGYRSEKIGDQLQEMGFKHVYNLFGGIFDWKNHDYDVVNQSGVTDSVHTYNKKWSKWLLKGIKVY